MWLKLSQETGSTEIPDARESFGRGQAPAWASKFPLPIQIRQRTIN